MCPLSSNCAIRLPLFPPQNTPNTRQTVAHVRRGRYHEPTRTPCRSQTSDSPPESGSEAALAAVLAASAPGAAAAGDRRLANLILADVAAIAALGRPPVLCALADLQRIIAAASAVATVAAAEASVTREPRQATAFRPLGATGRSSGNNSSCGREARGAQQSETKDVTVLRPAPRHQSSTDGAWLAQQGEIESSGRARLSNLSRTIPNSAQAPAGQRFSAEQRRHRAIRRQMKIATMQLGDFLMPWVNEQPHPVYVSISQAAGEQWDRWQCVSPHPVLLKSCAHQQFYSR